MKILAVDTSTSCGAVGIGHNEEFLAQVNFPSKENLSAKLLPAIEWLLQTTGLSLSDMDGFGVSLGPGSFTGLRVGLATIKGFAWTLQKPMVGFSSLEILAYSLPSDPRPILALLDSGRGQVYAALYQKTSQSLVNLEPPRDCLIEEALPPQQNFLCVGNGILKHKERLIEMAQDRITFVPTGLNVAQGFSLCSLTREKLIKGQTLDIHTTQPMYLRKTAAEEKIKEL